MQVAELDHLTDFDGWRRGARALRAAGVVPSEAVFRVAGEGAQGGLFDTDIPPSGALRAPVFPQGSESATPSPPSGGSTREAGEGGLFTVPKAFVDLAQEVILHRSGDRFDLLYRLLWRLQDTPHLIRIVSDPDVADALDRAKNVSRASHKMKAFVRFRQVRDDRGEAWVAWFEPAHRVLERTAPFFQRRFTAMRWSILTPDGSAFWDTETLRFGRPATRDMAPAEDEIEEFWKTYYASTFNPARLKTKTMQGEMPRRYWKNLPEAALIPQLIAQSSQRTAEMVSAPAAVPNARFAHAIAPDIAPAGQADDAVPDTLAQVAAVIQGCRRCPLWRDTTQAVAGEGPSNARLMIVGEQPGDQEDLAGQPFVGPAGRVLDQALTQAGIDRSSVFLTNAVKHFKHEPRGKRRLHKTPNAGEVTACRWWLDHERRLVRPRVVLALGATAGFAVLGRKVAVTTERGRPIPLADGSIAVVTIHPAYLLRLPDEAARIAEQARFIEDLRVAATLI